MKDKPQPTGIYERRRRLFGNMPPLSHWPDRSLAFDYSRSEVCRWLSAIEPDVPPRSLMRQADEAGAIVYDSNAKLWRGCYFRVTLQEFEKVFGITLCPLSSAHYFSAGQISNEDDQ